VARGAMIYPTLIWAGALGLLDQGRWPFLTAIRKQRSRRPASLAWSKYIVRTGAGGLFAWRWKPRA